MNVHAKNLKRNMVEVKFGLEQDCPICLDSMHLKSTRHTLCGHTFHLKCDKNLLKYNHHCCPICRTPIHEQMNLEMHKSIDEMIREIVESMDLDLASVMPDEESPIP